VVVILVALVVMIMMMMMMMMIQQQKIMKYENVTFEINTCENEGSKISESWFFQQRDCYQSISRLVLFKFYNAEQQLQLIFRNFYITNTNVILSL
jgi:hypothetical protein